MTRRAPRTSFLVEHYRPGRSAAELGGLAARLRAALGELERGGEPVRLVHATVVPRDEALLCLVEASSEQLVRDACAGAGVPLERISPAIAAPA